MATSTDREGYMVWAVDNVVYGPVELSLLRQWVEEERVTGSTWVFKRSEDVWHKAGDLDELREWFQAVGGGGVPAAVPARAATAGSGEIKAGVLRQIRVLATLEDSQLERLRRHLRAEQVRQWEVLIKQGDPADGMYLIVHGEVRVRLVVDGKESIVATLGTGDFFGELSLFDNGPRSADVVANMDSLLLKLSAGEFQKMAVSEPELAAPFLAAVCKTVAARMRADNRRYANSLQMARFHPTPGRARE